MTSSVSLAPYQAPVSAFVACVIASISLYAAVVVCDRHGWWLAAGLVAAFSSYGVMAFARHFIEHGSLARLFDPHTASLAFLFGDAGLGLAVGMGSLLRARHFSHGWFTGGLWAACAYVLGWSIALAWHFGLDKPAYVRAGAAGLLDAPTKYAHDFVTYSALASAVLFVAIPALIGQFELKSIAWWLLVFGLLLWVAGGIKDTLVPPNVYNLHPLYDWTRHRITTFPHK